MARSSSIIFEILASDKNASKTIAKVTGTLEHQRKAVDALKVAATAQFAAVSAAATIFIKQSIEAYSTAEDAQAGLNYAYQKFPALADVSIDALREYNSELQRKSRYDDDAIATGQTVLAQFGLTGQQLRELTPLMLDYAARTGKDMRIAAEDLGKAILGQGRALKVLGVDFKDTGDRTKNYQQLVDGLSATIGGFAENESKTAAGQLAILKNAYGDLQEVVGEKLMPVLTDLIGVGTDAVEWAMENQGAAAALAGTVFTLSAGLAVAANWERIAATARTVHVAATWAYTKAQQAGNAVLAEFTGLRIAGNAATAQAIAAVNGLTAATAANTAVAAQNRSATTATAVGMSKWAKASLGAAGALAIVSAEYAYFKQLGDEHVALVDEMVAKRDELDAKGIDNLLEDLRELNTEIDNSNRDFWDAHFSGIRRINDLARDKGLIATNEAIADINSSLANTSVNLQAVAAETGVTYAALEQLAKREGLDLSGAFGSDAARLARERLTDYVKGLSDTERAQIELTDATEDYVDALEEQLKLQREIAGVVLDERSAARGYREALDAASKALAEHGATLDIATEAGRRNQDALDNIVKATWDWVEAGSEADVTAYELDRRLQAGRQAFIDAATQMGLTAEQATALATQMGLVPTSHHTVFTADTSQAIRAVNDLRASMNVEQFTRYNAARTNYSGLKRASGGPIYGPGTSTSDSIPVWASDEEWLIKARAANYWGADAMWAINNADARALFRALGARGLAGGGPVADLRPYVGLGGSTGPAPTPAVVSLEGMNVRLVDERGDLIGFLRAEVDDALAGEQRHRTAAMRS